MMRAAGDPQNTMRLPVVAARGATVFASSRVGSHGNRWGDYNATCLAPSDPTRVWTSQEYAASAEVDRWSTCWVAFALR